MIEGIEPLSLDGRPRKSGRKISEGDPEVMPRERLERDGPEVLADHELIAILLRTGTANEGVLRL